MEKCSKAFAKPSTTVPTAACNTRPSGMFDPSPLRCLPNRAPPRYARSDAHTLGGPQNFSRPCRPQSVVPAKTTRSYHQRPRGPPLSLPLTHKRRRRRRQRQRHRSLPHIRTPRLPAPLNRMCRRTRSLRSSSMRRTSSPRE